MKKYLYPFIILILLGPQHLEAQPTGFEVNQETENTASQPEYPELYKKNFQFTFMIPPFSTNWVQNSKTENKVSLNLFAGNAGAVNGAEIGFFLNTINYYAIGFQGAGFGNVVGGHVDGAQLAGFFNVAGSNVDKFQGAGFINVAGGYVHGAQLAGFLNITGKDTRGFQGAGFGNVTGTRVRGAQIAGLFNVATSYERGAQLAGFTSVTTAGTVNAQLSGFANVGKSIDGTQISGFGNVAREVEGAQITGFINVAGNVKGAQIAGFLNVCDSIDGVPIAFINVVRKNGYRNFDVSVSETQYFNFSYRMGIPHFYNIYSIGKPNGPGNRWFFGFGLGGERYIRENLSLNIEAQVNQEYWIAEPGTGRLFHIDRLNLLNQFRVLFNFHPNEKVDLYVGPTFNVAVAETNPDLGLLPWYEIGPNWAFYNKTYSNTGRTNVKIWFGIQGGIRL